MQVTLITTGRRSARPHEVILYAWPDGDRLVVVGSYAGSPRDPDWAANLRAHPRATVRIGRETRAYVAHEAACEERARLWDLVTEAFPMYRSYQERTERVIPLFALRPSPEVGE